MSKYVPLPGFWLVVLVKDKARDSFCASDLHLLNELSFVSQSEKEMEVDFSLSDHSIFGMSIAP